MAVFASENIPLWRDVFRAADVLLSRLDSVDSLCLLPTTSKKTLLEWPLEDRLGIPESECVKMSTSGTTGGPMPVFYSKKFYDFIIGLIRFRLRRMQRVPFYSKSANITYDAMANQANSPSSKPVVMRRSNALGSLTPVAGPLYDRLTKRFYISSDIDEIIDDLISFSAGRIAASPAYLRMLAEAVRADPTIKFHLHSGISMGEPLDQPTRQYLERYLECDIFDGYGSNETGIIAVECEHKSGLHIVSDSVVVEVLREGKPVREGEEGDVYVTTLRNKAMPLFSYDMGDRAVMGGSHCACGRRTLKPKSVEGRRIDYIMAKDGRMVSPRRISTLIHSVDDTPKCQLVEIERFRFKLRVFGEECPAELVDSLYGELGDVAISVSTERPDALKAKFRPVVSVYSMQVDKRWTRPLKKLESTV